MDESSEVGKIIKWAFGAVGLGAVASAFGIPKYGIWVALIIVLLFILLVGGYLAWRAWQRKHERSRFSSAIEQHTAATPHGISDPAKRAKLDDLRRKFQEGLTVCQTRLSKEKGGLYLLPWYVFIGEPGSGKTEAIRHSNVSLAPGLQDEFQGVGGTVNMNWWFTQNAIFLDTAGRLMFEEIKPGESSEWQEFLKLLKKTRTRCPINGLFLVMPVDSLIKDSADKIAQKAGRIAQQLDVIQRTLDVRFPVYVLVTKCDLLTGFREFFDGIDDPQLQHQMMGWSNPDPLDAPFRPDQVDQHLTQVAQRLRRRRLGLLRDQLASDESPERKTDLVDSLFALPNSLMLIAPRLRRYLETIFVAGVWSTKPVFLRGIYFTSSLREGNDLDEALATALGIPITDLPGGKVWDKDRAFFLRDLFCEKAFKESGLVTPATNTRHMLRNRQLAIMGCGFAALILLTVFAWLGKRSLNKSIEGEAGRWSIASDPGRWTTNEQWKPIITRTEGGLYNYRGHEPLEANAKQPTLAQFHCQLAQMVQQPLRVAWVFRPIEWMRKVVSADLDEKRRSAQRLVFEQGVLRPIAWETRAMMVLNPAAGATNDPARRIAQQEALKTLIQLEVDDAAQPKTGLDTNKASLVLSNWLSYLTATNHPVDTNLLPVMTWLYAKAWPPAWLATNKESLKANPSIDRGLDTFIANVNISQIEQTQRLAVLNQVRDAVQRFRVVETRLFNQAAAKQPIGDEIKQLSVLKGLLDQALRTATAKDAISGGAFSLQTNYSRLLDSSKKSSADQLAAMRIGTNRVPQGRYSGIFTDIDERLASAARGGTVKIIETSINSDTNLATYDDFFLQSFHDARLFDFRHKLYESALNLTQQELPQFDSYFGQRWKPILGLVSIADGVKSNAASYASQPYGLPAREVCNYLIENTVLALNDRLFEDYTNRVSATIRQLKAVEFSKVSFIFLTNAKALFFDKLDADLGASAMVPEPQKSKLQPLLTDTELTRKILGTNYLNNRRMEALRLAGFPVLFDSANPPLSLEQIKTLKAFAETAVTNEFASAEVRYFCGAPTGKLADQMKPVTDILQVLMAADGLPRKCKIKVDPQLVGSDAKRFRSLSIGVGGNAPQYEDISGVVKIFPEFSLDQSLRIGIRRFDSDPKPLNPGDEFSAWGPLELIRKYQGTVERQANGLSWLVPISVNDGERRAAVKLELVFDRALPVLSEWPRKQSLE